MLKSKKLKIGYKGKFQVSKLDFIVQAKQVTAVIGHNGSGKSTLVRTLAGLQPPLDGTLEWINGKPRAIAYVGQNTELDNQFPMRVRDVVAMGAWRGLNFWRAVDKVALENIDGALERTGLTNMADKPLYECSMGQIQRCFFARAIVQDAPFLILDEPFSAIDQTTEDHLLDIIRGWRDEGRAVLIVLHDISSVLNISDKCLLLGANKSFFGETKSVINSNNLIAFDYMTPVQAKLLSFFLKNEVRNV